LDQEVEGAKLKYKLKVTAWANMPATGDGRLCDKNNDFCNCSAYIKVKNGGVVVDMGIK